MGAVRVLPDLPFGWRWESLGDVASWSSGGTPKSRTPRYYGGHIPWAVIGDLNDGVVTHTVGTITSAGLAASSAKVVPAGTVLVAMYGSIGKLGIAGTEMATNQAIACARPISSVDPKYLFYWLLGQRLTLLAAGKGGTQANISQSILKPWPIPVPPLEEQRRIVAILDDHLSRLDAADAILQKSSVRLRGLGEAIMRSELLGTTNVGERHSPELSAVGTNDGVLADLPPGWRWTRLGELADVVGGVTKDSKRQSDPSFVEVPYLRVANVQRGRLDLSKISTIRVPPARAAALLLLPGDVLLNEGGDRDKLGRGWVWDGQIPDCIHQNHVFRARVIDDSIVPRLLSWAANVIGGPWCESNGIQSVNLASISLKKIRLMPVPVPPVELQPAIAAKIADRLAGIEHLHRDLDAALNRSKALRRSLLEEAFSGRLTGAAAEPDSDVESAATEASSAYPPISQAYSAAIAAAPSSPTPTPEDASHD